MRSSTYLKVQKKLYWNPDFRNPFLLVILLLLPGESLFAFSALTSDQDTLKKSSFNASPWILGGLYTGTSIGLYQAWYKNYPLSGFRWNNDNQEWLQMDKVGHAFSAYQEARLGHYFLKKSGMTTDKAMNLATGMALAFQLSVEVLDGMSENWGASWGDLTANALGAALILGQHYTYGDQRIQIKYSWHPTYKAAARPNVLGKTLPERMLKDYNGQTYWASVNLYDFSKKAEPKLPKWLNVAVGYGAENLYGGSNNIFIDANGKTIDLSHKTRYRQFYLSLDLDLSKIETDKNWKRTVLFMLNAIKIPAPTLIINGKGGIDSRLLYF